MNIYKERLTLDKDHPGGKPYVRTNKTDCFKKLREYERLGTIEDFYNLKQISTVAPNIEPRYILEVLNAIDEAKFINQMKEAISK